MLKPWLKRATYSGSAAYLLVFLPFIIGCGESLSPADSPAEATRDLCTEFLAASTGKPITAACEDDWLVASTTDGFPAPDGIGSMMVGVTSWIQRVPVPYAYEWRIPRSPTWTGTTTAASPRGPIAVAIDGVPIFHYERRPDVSTSLDDYDPNNDTVLQGELDECGGHAGQGEDYHYHYTPICLLATHDPVLPVAFGLDGAPVYFGEGGTDYYGGGRFSDLSMLPAAPLDDCNAAMNGDGSYSHFSTKTPPYLIGCHHGFVDANLQIEPRPMSGRAQGLPSVFGGELGEPVSTLVTSFQVAGAGYRMEFLAVDGSGRTSAVLYEPVSGSDECWRFELRVDRDVEGVVMESCRQLSSTNQVMEASAFYHSHDHGQPPRRP